MNQSQAIRVMIVDSDANVRAGLGEVLGADARIRVVGGANSARSGVERALALQPDVVVMDLRLADGSGVEAARAIRSANPLSRVVVHASYGGDDALLATVLAGASGYVLKDLNVAPLIEGILAAAGSRSLLEPRAVERAVRRLSRIAGIVDAPPALAAVPGGGPALIARIADGLTDAQIAERLDVDEEAVRRYAALLYESAGRTTL